MASRIEDYALLGDCQAAALVGRDGSVDWLCWPRFDSDACFAALLGDGNNGRWQVAPCEPARIERCYRPDTMVLETHINTASGEAVVIDFMPPRGDSAASLVRIVEGISGRVDFHTELVIRFGYGGTIPWVSRTEAGDLRAIAGPDMLVLRTTVPLRGQGLTTVGEWSVQAGERVAFVLTYRPSHLPPPDPFDAEAALRDTEAFWRDWVASGHGGRSELVTRSLLTLKALTYAPTGGIVAAPTTSLPECLGGSRNWDYRLCWLRDATLSLLSLMNAGHYGEAHAWRDWLLRAAAGSPWQIQTLYGLAGERWLGERDVPWLAGYEGARPVRVGNAAADQLQIDVYGEVMDALHQGRRGGLAHVKAGWELQRALLAHLERIWTQPDESIWEVRGPRQHFTYSKVMAWVAFDRGIKGAELFGLQGPVERWRKIRADIHEQVCAQGFSTRLGSFVQSFGSELLDASALLIPTLGFLPPSDPRIKGTIAAIERRLMRDGFVLRYDTAGTEDGLPPGEGAFLACSFWLADAYVLLGRPAEAHALFNRLCGLCNDVGLLAEEYDPAQRRLVGNFPQAFSHIALVNSAQNLGHPGKPNEQRSGHACLDRSP